MPLALPGRRTTIFASLSAVLNTLGPLAVSGCAPEIRGLTSMKTRKREEQHAACGLESCPSPAEWLRATKDMLRYFGPCDGARVLLGRQTHAANVENENSALKSERIDVREYVRGITTPDTAAYVECFASRWLRKFPFRRLPLTEWRQEFEAWLFLQGVGPVLGEALTCSDDSAVLFDREIEHLLNAYLEWNEQNRVALSASSITEH